VVSCSGQQHGSVYWSEPGLAALAEPDASATGFATALPVDSCFAVADSPIWADSSTGAQCATIEAAFEGGASTVAKLTGSRAYERFTGPQVAAVASRMPEAWARTERISLVSSFGAALLTGHHQPMDSADASGTLLMNLASRQWCSTMLSCGGFPEDLRRKLGAEPVPAHAIVGTVSPFVSSRWGLPLSCAVAASSGDNPCAIAGLGLALPGDLALSLGTSDTLLGVAPITAATRGATEGHLMAHPTSPESSLMAMLCYKNGGASRQAVRDELCGAKWSAFDDALERSPPGNDGILGLSLPLPEITPIIARAGEWYVDGADRAIARERLSAEAVVRTVVEGRFLSMRARAAAIGLGTARRVLATGGGSQSAGLLQVAADVFNAEVLSSDCPDAAAVGAARRAAHALALATSEDPDEPSTLPYAQFLDEAEVGAGSLSVAATPRRDAAEIYSDELVARYKRLEDRVAAGEIQ